METDAMNDKTTILARETFQPVTLVSGDTIVVNYNVNGVAVELARYEATDSRVYDEVVILDTVFEGRDARGALLLEVN
jgi:hypothetical protein